MRVILNRKSKLDLLLEGRKENAAAAIVKKINDLELIKYLSGEIGSIFAVDTWAWHSGNKNIKTNRLVTWVRFTACPANTYFTDRNYLFKDELKDFNNS